VLEEPRTGRDLLDIASRGKPPGTIGRSIPVGNVLQSPAANLPTNVANTGKVECLNPGPRVAGDAPADLIRHPVSDSRENLLVQEERLDRSALPAGSYPAEIIQCKPVVDYFYREALPGIMAGRVEEDAPELPIVGIDQGQLLRSQDEVIVFTGIMTGLRKK